MSRYHLYQKRIIRKDGSVSKTWYYWFIGSDGGRVRRSTGCEKKREAEAFLEALEIKEEEAENARALALSRGPRACLREVGDPMFKAKAAHLERWAQKGRHLTEHTINEHRRWIDLYILPAFGDRWVDEITGPEIEDWLSTLTSVSKGRGLRGDHLTNSTRNGIARTFGLVLAEAKRQGFLQVIPDLELFERNSQKKDILLDADLELLFPECPAALSLIWRRRPGGNREAEPWEVGLLFGTLFALSGSAGLRPGEGRAVFLDQLYRQIGGMIVDRAFDNAGILGAPKKSTEGDPRYRVSYIPERTWRMLDFWLKHRTEAEEYPGLLFAFHGAPISPYFLDERFEIGLKNAGISKVGRILTPHSLRFTYDTKMRGVLSGDILREFIGHRSETMTDYYDRASLRPVLEARLIQLADQRPAVERFWDRNEVVA